MVEGEKKKYEAKEQEYVTLVRVLGKDIRGDLKLLAGLTKIAGISWSFANAICKVLELDKDVRIQDMDKADLERISEFVKAPAVPGFLKNRQKDFDNGEDVHLNGADLKLKKEFDIKRLRKIKSYRGIRHGAGLPTRGQRTKGNFRKNRKKSGATAGKK